MTNEICVIYNPTAGRGRALGRMESLRRYLAGRADFWPTNKCGHAEELAHKAASSGYAVVGAAGGDGTVHEVASGILRASAPDVTMAIYPVGSANDYAYSLGLNAGWWEQPDAKVENCAVDMGMVRTTDGRERHFINCLGFGLNGIVNMEARRIHYLQGKFLYGLALMRVMCNQYASPLTSVTLDGQTREVPTLSLTLAIGRREGGFIMATNALVDDGLFDYVHAGPLPRWQVLSNLPRMIMGRPSNNPIIWTGRCREARISSETPLVVHADGEVFTEPAQQIHSVEVRILPGALRVQRRATKTT